MIFRTYTLVILTFCFHPSIFSFEELNGIEKVRWRQNIENHNVDAIYAQCLEIWNSCHDTICVAYFSEALRFFKSENLVNDTLTGRIWTLYGLANQDLNLEKSIDALKTALIQYKRAYPPNHIRLHSLYFQLAEKLYFDDRFFESQRYLDTSIIYQMTTPKTANWPRVLTLQSRLFSSSGDFRRSILYLTTAKPYIDKFHSDDLDFYKIIEAGVYRDFDFPKESIRVLRGLSGSPNMSFYKFSQIAQAYNGLNKYDSALYYLARQLEVPNLELVSELNWLYTNRAIVYDRMGEFHRALKASQKVKLSKSEGIDSLMHLVIRSNLYLHLGYPDTAFTICKNLIDEFLMNPKVKPYQIAYYFKSYLNQLSKLNVSDAEAPLAEVSDLGTRVDQLLKESRRRLSSAESRREYARNCHSFYDKLIELLTILYIRNKKEIQSEDIIEFVESTKALVLQEEFAEKRAEESRKLKYRKKYEELEAMMEKETDLDKRISISDSIFYWLQREEQDTLIFQNESAELAPDIPAFIEQPDVTYLNYFQHEDTSLTIVVIGNGKSSLHHLDHADWYYLVENRLREIRNYSLGEFDRYDVTDSLLFNYILPFSDSEIPPKLVIVPDGILSYFPFEVLRDRDQKYLITHSSISYSFSLAMLDQLQRYPSMSGVPLIMAPHFEGDVFLTVRSLSDRSIKLGALQFNRDEASEVSNILGKSNLFLNEDASIANFYAHCGASSIIHIATHAFASEDEDQKAQIIFDESSRPNTMYLSEIYNQRIPANMVVMSACETAIGRYLPGEGVMSFARGFMAAGSKAVIASLWSVNDESTSEIMGSLYKNLKRGKSKDEALRRAKLDFINSSDPQTQHPFFWAGMVTIGDQSPIDQTGNLKLFFLIVGIILLLSFPLYWYRRRTYLMLF